MSYIVISTKDYQWKKEEVKETSSNQIDVEINTEKVDQTIHGFGGAFTDAASITFHSLSKAKQEEYLRAYFSNEGLGYSLGRYPLQSCDFSTHSYSYINKDKQFDMSMDKERIEFVQRALEYNPNLWLISAPWSPPAFMKDNGDMCHGGHLLPEYYDLWAQTIVAAIKELKKNGITINCVTTQNEPEATQTWESCRYSAEQEAKFLKDYLIPTAKKERLDDLKYMIWDHNRDVMLKRTDEVLSFGLKQEDIYGVAYHWYDRDAFEEVKKTHNKYPALHLLLTECCVELLCDDNSGLGSWQNGMRYAINIIKDLNNGSEGYIDWNLSLDTKGGPNHVGNYCEAPLLIDSEKDEIICMPSYYIIGHFSRYLRPGFERVEATSKMGDLLVAGFKKNNRVSVVFVNENTAKTVYFKLFNKIFNIFLPENCIATFVYE